MNPKLFERFVQRARDLAYGMHERTGRLPDFADFRAAFRAELAEFEAGEKFSWLNTPEASGPVADVPRTSPYHPTKL